MSELTDAQAALRIASDTLSDEQSRQRLTGEIDRALLVDLALARSEALTRLVDAVHRERGA